LKHGPLSHSSISKMLYVSLYKLMENKVTEKVRYLKANISVPFSKCSYKYTDIFENIQLFYMLHVGVIMIMYAYITYIKYAIGHLLKYLFVLFWVFTSHRHSIGHSVTFQLYWWRKTSDALPCIISCTNGHLSTWSRTTDVP
jgi:hypothetical protein